MQRLAGSVQVVQAVVGLLSCCCLIDDAQVLQVLQDALGQVVFEVGGLSEEALPLLAHQGGLPLLLSLLSPLSLLLSSLRNTQYSMAPGILPSQLEILSRGLTLEYSISCEMKEEERKR